VEQPARIRYAAAALSLAAALIHAWAIPEHFGEWWGYGAFFLVVAVSQVYLSDGLLYRPRRRLFLVGVVGNLAVITLYVVTRTVGIPFFGPHAGEVEDTGIVDLASVVAEMALVAALLSLLRARSTVGSSQVRRARSAADLPGENVER
jgi:energy-coupling factor transporter transmembrane protein EcfT